MQCIWKRCCVRSAFECLISLNIVTWYTYRDPKIHRFAIRVYCRLLEQGRIDAYDQYWIIIVFFRGRLHKYSHILYNISKVEQVGARYWKEMLRSLYAWISNFYIIIVTSYIYRDSKILALLLRFTVHCYTLFLFTIKVPKARTHTRPCLWSINIE